jgi:hypothetical protein
MCPPSRHIHSYIITTILCGRAIRGKKKGLLDGLCGEKEWVGKWNAVPAKPDVSSGRIMDSS